MSSIQERIKAARLRAKGASTSSNLFETPTKKGGLGDEDVDISPLEAGEELYWVRDPTLLCLGRIGTDGKACLLERKSCKVASHETQKCELPAEPFLTMSKGHLKGCEKVILKTAQFDIELIQELLTKQEIDWVKEFALVRAGSKFTVAGLEDTHELLQSVSKYKSLETPNKRNAASDLASQVDVLTDMTKFIVELTGATYDDDGVRTNPPAIEFTEASYSTLIKNLLEQIELFGDFAMSTTRILGGQQDRLRVQTQPLEEMMEGLRLDLTSTKASLGDKDIQRIDVPHDAWSALEKGYEMIHSLECALIEARNIALEARENTDVILLELDSSSTNYSKSSKIKEEKDSHHNDPSLEFIRNLKSPTVIDGRLYHPASGGDDEDEKKVRFFGSSSDRNRENNTPFATNPGGNNPGGSGGCDNNASMCNICMNRMDRMEEMILNCLTRISNLEDAKNSNVESAILIKEQVFRGRSDICAWLDRHFPLESDKAIEGGCFPSPHYILNLVTADMCSRNYPKIPLEEKDLSRMGIKRPDATSYFALQTDKPDFMLTTSPCPSHVYKANKVDRDKAPFKFIPSYSDFGRSSDSESLHHRFKVLLHHVSQRQEKYIESRLADHGDSKVYDISKQLLADSLKFVTEMLDFMEELYSACNDSFNAPSEAWELVCHCLEELFTKEFKPSLRFCVSQDLVDARESLIGVVHTAFSLNMKVRELLATRLKNHSSTTTSHVRFVMKMAKGQKKGDDKVDNLKSEITKLKTENEALKKQNDESKATLKRLESRIDSHISTYQKERKQWNKLSAASAPSKPE